MIFQARTKTKIFLSNWAPEWGDDAKIDVIVAEPNFSMNLLPWHNLLYWYCLKHVSASKGITEETKVGMVG